MDGVNDFVVGEADVLLDYLRTRQSLQDIDRAAAMSDLPASGFPLDLDFRSLEFANTVYQQRYATIVLLSYLRLLDDVALQVLAQVEEG